MNQLAFFILIYVIIELIPVIRGYRQTRPCDMSPPPLLTADLARSYAIGTARISSPVSSEYPIGLPQRSSNQRRKLEPEPSFTRALSHSTEVWNTHEGLSLATRVLTSIPPNTRCIGRTRSPMMRCRS